MDKKVVRTVLLVALLLLLGACTEAKAADRAATPGSIPGLKPVPAEPFGVQATLPAAMDEPDDPLSAIRPPTGTPTPGQAGDNQAFVPTATHQPTPAATPRISIDPTPQGGQGQAPGNSGSSLAESLDCVAEIESYEEKLLSDPALAAYDAPIISDCYLALGDRPAAITTYETAIEAGVDRITEVALRQGLAGLLVEDGDYPAALAHYEVILSLAQTDITRSQVLYQAGRTELLAGNSEAGYARYSTLVYDYPAADESYQALTELLAAGITVDDYQQGQVAYQARAYHMAAAAFERAVNTDQVQQQDSYLYLAWSLERLGDVEGALAQLDVAISANEAAGDGVSGEAAEAARGRIERAKMLSRDGRTQAALGDYQAYLALYPSGEQAPMAAWQSALLTEELGYLTAARDRYLAFVDGYADHKDAAQALFRAGYLSWRLGDSDDALAIWQLTADAYPEKEYGAAALLWLIKNAPAGDVSAYMEAALNGPGQGYYAARARHLNSGVPPFTTAGTVNLVTGDSGRDFAESWLREWLGLAAGAPLGELSAELAADPRQIRGERLWSKGLRAEATGYFESLRADYAGDALASYQLALYFRDLGLYRSSILAANSVMILAGASVSEAPRFLARLAYPAYYADLVMVEAERYGYDPLLQLALIREESYFDTLATSPAGAQGLNQVLPETGENIAGQLGWPGYQNGDLYRPAVNIPFGAYFLGQQLDNYNGNVAAALAAYNAGPGFAAGWYEAEADDMDVFLEVVDFPETQRYIRQIYNVHAIYRFLYS